MTTPEQARAQLMSAVDVEPYRARSSWTCRQEFRMDTKLQARPEPFQVDPRWLTPVRKDPAVRM
jgi:hypothetical protein